MKRRLWLLCAALSLSLPAAVYAAPKAPTAIDAKAKVWMNALQTGSWDRAQLTAKANALLTPAAIRSFEAAYKPMGRALSFRFTGAQPVPGGTEYNFVVTLQHARVNELFLVDGQGQLVYLFTPTAAPRLSEAKLLTALQQRLQHDAAAGRFSGAVLVARNGRGIFARAYGFADRKRHIANTLQTRFRIGSMNKMFTAVAVMQLVQAGKIRLSDAFGTYVKDYPNAEVSSRVTIAELLTHTGGTGDFFGPLFDKHRLDLKTLDDYEHVFGKRGNVSPIGKYAYSNYGYILLGLVIERVSGESYYDYVRQHVYAPAGMAASGSLPEDEAVPSRSVGYMHSNGHLVSNATTLPYRGIPAGGGYSTVGDMLKFANALQSHKLLNAYYTTLLTTPQVRRRPGLGYYAYGFANDFFNGIFCFGHNGGAPGMSGELDICARNGYTVTVLSNFDPPAAMAISRFIVDRLPPVR